MLTPPTHLNGIFHYFFFTLPISWNFLMLCDMMSSTPTYVNNPTMCLSSHSCVICSATLSLLSIANSLHIEAEHIKS